MPDYRLYIYDGNGNIRKVGRNKSELFQPDKHFFDSMMSIHQHVEWLMEQRHFRKGTQFVVIEYFRDSQNYKHSRIADLINR